MASIIDNKFFFDQAIPNKPQPNSAHKDQNLLQKYIMSILSQNRQKLSSVHITSNMISICIYHNAAALAHISLHLGLNIISLKIKVMREDKVLKVDSRSKLDVFCRLFQKCNTYLSQQQNIQFAINPNNGEIIVRCYLIYYLSCLSLQEIKAITEISNRMVRLINEQMIFLFECVNQTFSMEIYKKDPRYLDKIVSESNEALKIRELIALSSVNFEESGENIQLKYTRNKELINFLTHRENIVNSKIRKQYFIGNQLELFTLFLENEYFQTQQMTLNKLQQGFTKEFQTFFYKFQVKKVDDGDNTYLFNTILIKNEDQVKPVDISLHGGFSRIEVADMEIVYTESQNSVFQGAPDKSRSKSRQKESKNKNEKLTYFSKQVAIKISKKDQDYEKIKHQKLIVQNFRTVSSAFLLKYYNCTQRKFRYRHYLLMDYLGPNLTLSEYNEVHKMTFSMQFKMHVFIHISNALIFLEKQRVVHMDLTSSNVMIAKDLLVKVIDFGEAYHPYVDTDKTIKYLPGYTLPYCPPETFNTIKKFNHPSDVFSFGIILFRIIFGDFPFYPTHELMQSFINRTYLGKLLLAPERLCQYGYHTQLLLLLQLIMRCLSPDEKIRPTPYWLYVILNKIFLTFK